MRCGYDTATNHIVFLIILFWSYPLSESSYNLENGPFFWSGRQKEDSGPTARSTGAMYKTSGHAVLDGVSEKVAKPCHSTNQTRNTRVHCRSGPQHDYFKTKYVD